MSVETPPEPGGNPNPGEPGSGGNTPNPDDVDFVPKSEYEKVSRANNWAQSQHKEIKAKFDSLQAQFDELSSKKPVKDDGKKSDRLVAAETKIQEQAESLVAANKQIRDFTVKGKVLEQARGVVRDDALEAFWQLEGSKFDVVEFNGEQHVGLKDQPYTKLSDYFSDHVKENLGFLVVNQRTNGTGAPSKSDPQKDGATLSMRELEGKSNRERIEIFTKDPKIRETWMRHKGMIS